MRKIVMLGAAPRTQRSLSSVQLPVDFSSSTSSVPVFAYRTSDFIFDLRAPAPEASSTEGEVKKKEETTETGQATPTTVPAPASTSPRRNRQQLKELLLQRWEAAKEKNAFNYKLNIIYKLLDGSYNFSIQLNVERGELRRKPMRFRHIREPFNPLRWNFTKLNESECEDRPISRDQLDRHIVAVNASPLERGHSLVVPAVLNETALRLAVDLMLLTRDENFHMLFNSLLGQASVNHLHLHALFWPYDSDLINRRFEPLSEEVDHVFVIRPPLWMTNAFAFQLVDRQHYDQFIQNLTRCAELLTEKEIAHNLFFSRAQPIRTEGAEEEEDRRGERPQLVTAYIFPRASVTGAKPPTNFNPAACELAGCLTSYTWRFFESVTQQSAVRVIEDEALLPETVFHKLVGDLTDVLCGRSMHYQNGAREEGEWDEEGGLTSPELDELRDSFASFEPRSPSRAVGRQRGGSMDSQKRGLTVPHSLSAD